MATLSTHVLDTATGRPAPGVAVSVERESRVVASGVTDADGRIAHLGESLEPGRYRSCLARGPLLQARRARHRDRVRPHIPRAVLAHGRLDDDYRGS